MKLAKLSLIITANGFAGLGITLLIFPGLLEIVGVMELTGSGTIEIRAFYGGLELGIALFFLLAINRPKWLKPALVLQVCILGGVAIGRMLGLVITSWQAQLVIYIILAAEGTLAILGAVALSKLQSEKPKIDESKL